MLPFSRRFKKWLRSISDEEYLAVVEWLDEDYFRPTLTDSYIMQHTQETHLLGYPLPTKKGEKNRRAQARKRLKLSDWRLERESRVKKSEMSPEFRRDTLNLMKGVAHQRFMIGRGTVRKRNPDGTFTETVQDGNMRREKDPRPTRPRGDTPNKVPVYYQAPREDLEPITDLPPDSFPQKESRRRRRR